jgi:endogenous inhibitor of DNA gyrase (YacG/DUF329 family)
MSSARSTPRRGNGCPLCGEPSDRSHAPFCSRGCKDRDLLKWLGDGYRVPGPPADEPGSEFTGDGLDSEG